MAPPPLPVTVTIKFCTGALDVLVIVRVAVTAPVPVIVAGEETVQLGVAGSPAHGAAWTLQINVTFPVNPLVGVTVILDVAPWPGAAISIGVPERENFGPLFTLWFWFMPIQFFTAVP